METLSEKQSPSNMAQSDAGPEEMPQETEINRQSEELQEQPLSVQGPSRNTTSDSGSKTKQYGDIRDVICNVCYKKGHETLNCPKAIFRCRFCGRIGHFARGCNWRKWRPF